MGWPRPYENLGIRANRYVLVLARRIATKRSGKWKMRVQRVRRGIEWEPCRPQRKASKLRNAEDSMAKPSASVVIEHRAESTCEHCRRTYLRGSLRGCGNRSMRDELRLPGRRTFPGNRRTDCPDRFQGRSRPTGRW